MTPPNSVQFISQNVLYYIYIWTESCHLSLLLLGSHLLLLLFVSAPSLRYKGCLAPPGCLLPEDPEEEQEVGDIDEEGACDTLAVNVLKRAA